MAHAAKPDNLVDPEPLQGIEVKQKLEPRAQCTHTPEPCIQQPETMLQLRATILHPGLRPSSTEHTPKSLYL